MKAQIEKTLSELKSEFAKLDSTDSEHTETISQIIERLEQQIQNPEIDNHSGMIKTLQSARDNFEISHPAITSSINDLLVKLGGMGI